MDTNPTEMKTPIGLLILLGIYRNLGMECISPKGKVL